MNEILAAAEKYEAHSQTCSICRDTPELCDTGLELLRAFEQAMTDTIIREKREKGET